MTEVLLAVKSSDMPETEKKAAQPAIDMADRARKIRNIVFIALYKFVVKKKKVRMKPHLKNKQNQFNRA